MSQSAPDSTAPPPSRAARIEDGAVIVSLVLLAAIPTAQVVVRLLFDAALTAAAGYVRHLVVWAALLTGIVATRERQHLSLSAGLPKLPAPYDRWAAIAATTITVAVTTGIAVSATSLTLVAFGAYERVGMFPKRAVLAILPVGFGLMALRMVLAAARPREEGRSGRAGTAAGVVGIALGVILSTQPLANLTVSVSWEIGTGLPAAMETTLLDLATP